MKFRGTWAFLALALVFGAYIYFVEIKKTAKDEEAKTQSERIFPVEADKVKSLQIMNTNGTFDLERDAKGDWQLKTPLADNADDQTVSSIITDMTSERFDEIVSEGDVDLKTYGLDSPKISVTMTTAESGPKKLSVGIDAALPGHVYVQKEGDKRVLFASSSLKAQLEKSLKDLRDKRVFRGSKSDVNMIELGDITVSKKDKTWSLIKPISGLADEDTINTFLNNIEGLRASEFISEKQLGLDKPELEIRLSDKDGKSLSHISISPKKNGNTFVKVDDVQSTYQVLGTSTDALAKKVDDFRDKKTPFEMRAEDASEIIYKTSLVNLDLVKKSTGWEQSVPDPKKTVDQSQVSNLLEKLKNFKIHEFLKGETPKGLTPPSGPHGSLTLKDSKGALIIGYNWGDKTKSGKSYFIKTTKGTEVYGIESTLIDTMPGQTLVEVKVSK